MSVAAHRPKAPAPIWVDLGAIFISMELSQSKWLITSLSPGSAQKLSKFTLTNGDVAGLLARFAELQRKAQARTARHFPLIVIQEAGLDGFRIYRVLEVERIESHVVDPASIAVSRRKRRVKTDRIDGETLIRTVLAYKRGEPRVCAMVRAPTPEEEDRRRVSRERKSLMDEGVRHTNRIKGLLFGQGISGYEPTSPRSACTTGGTHNRRRAPFSCPFEIADQPRARPVRACVQTDQRVRADARCFAHRGASRRFD